ncbi:ABC transporter substrate-binding protein [Halalkalicoccus sp. NIPERK01]|uniref:ABC transporter substrate-binding protein n=1 Tax=Halalkalicoccus sp. NIPERK01 TaxID=3053469 RepID=UPI00256EA7BA|nr:ABC transporter substrate-binding protein [Halalkalicoccus sp. NIPERK01]MDL5360709.1 ABC transporter substrate-binding protein [Halalkalicoccus sp. NIPERK01]
MANDETSGTPTRRNYVKGVGGGIIAGAIAGCLGGGGGSNDSDSTGSNGDGAVTVELSPVGEVEFGAVPESAFTVFPQYADMAVSLGHGGAVNSMFSTEMAGTIMNHYYERLPGVSFEWEDLANPWQNGLPKERLYELDSDVHFVDPTYVTSLENWSQDDIDEISEGLAPFFGNFYSGTHAEPAGEYDGEYRYYTLWELFGTVAQVFREEERYEALASVHEDLLATIEEGLPPEDERPTAVRVTQSGEGFYTYHLNKPGYWLADTRPLGAVDAFAEEDWSALWGTVGYEAMLEADPDVILHLWGLGPDYDMGQVRDDLESHPVGSQLSAVENDRVYPAGMRYQGPIMNLFQLEMGAKQLYPDVFGEWPEYAEGEPYPAIPAEERLFDRERVAGIVTGED